MSAPKWAIGMRRIGPGMYVDRNRALHISERELCEHLGVPDTPENCRIAEQAAIDAFSQAFGKEMKAEYIHEGDE